MWLTNKKPKRILVVGDVMLDQCWHGQVQRISPEAPVPISQIKEVRYYPGGAANVALNIASLNDQVELIGCIGNDEAGNILKNLLSKRGITHCLIKTEKQQTISKLRLVAHNQQLMRADYDSDFAICSQQLFDIYKTKLQQADLVVFSDYHKGTLTKITAMIRLAKQAGKKVLVDPKNKDFSIYSHADLLTPNLHEFQAVVGLCKDQELIDKGRQLTKALKLQALLITRSEHGMTLITQSDHLHLPAHIQEVADVTGAGDTVIAVTASCLAHNIGLEQAVDMANVAAGISVSHFGAYAVTDMQLRQAVLARKQASMHFGIVNLNTLQEYVTVAKALGEKLVFTNGCFDLLHLGHIRYLNQAKQLGDRLIVAVNSDESIRQLKGSQRPIVNLAQRMEVLANLHMTDWITDFDDLTPHKLLQTLKPDILVKGDDYKSTREIVGADIVSSYGGKVSIVAVHVKDLSTTHIINKIKKLV